MKIWADAELEVITISKTQYGGSSSTTLDNVYQNSEGNWEGTFNPS